jgi:hypothetical protein
VCENFIVFGWQDALDFRPCLASTAIKLGDRNLECADMSAR